MYRSMFCLMLSVMLTPLFAQNNPDNRTLFTIGNDKVTVADFEYVYNKNNINNQDDYSKKSLDDYLKLYEDFRLKVQEAEALKMDTIASLKNELAGYRKQLAKSYLTDREITDKLIQEAYDRSKTEINASHILIRCDEDANPADTLAAYKKIMAIRKRLLKGENFEKVAKEYSEDPSAKSNGGNIGWFTVFGTIYPFESAAYSLKPGELSMPVRTQFGYHLIRVNETRPARGQIHVAHILIRFPKDATQAERDSVHKRADSVYALIHSGKIDFETGVKDFSDDKGSRVKDGELNWFGSGAPIRMVPEFEDAAFALTTPGEISKPVMTQFGWHIIKLLERKGIQPFDEVKETLKKEVARDSRSQVAKNKLIEQIKKENNFTEYPNVLNDFNVKVDSSLLRGDWKAGADLMTDKTLFTLAGKNYTQTDYADYIEKNAKRRSDKPLNELLNEYYDGFVNTTCLAYEESMLEVKKPEFRNLMKEYHDGILLFELMDRMVWTKAVKDTAGLEEYRKNHESKYMWGNRAQVAIFNCNDSKICDAAYKLARKNKPVDVIKEKLNNNKKNEHVSTIEGKYEKGQYDVVDKVPWQAGVNPVEKLNDSTYRFVWVKQIVGPEPKTLQEAKGYIVSDYQEYLEKTWLDQLRKKYPIHVNEEGFQSLIKK